MLALRVGLRALQPPGKFQHHSSVETDRQVAWESVLLYVFFAAYYHSDEVSPVNITRGGRSRFLMAEIRAGQ